MSLDRPAAQGSRSATRPGLGHEVVAVRTESQRIGGKAHEHVLGVLTSTGTYLTNTEVVAALRGGARFHVVVEGRPRAEIRERIFCPAKACLLRPYLTTATEPGETSLLEELPRV